jgi:transcriptional regulator with XRE-family HTH domain
MFNDNILVLNNSAPEQLMLGVAQRVRQRRLERNWTQKLLASKSGIPLATYRRFESLGEISLRGLVMIAIALNYENDLKELFSSKSYQSIDELMDSTEIESRKRGTKNE